MGDGGKRRTLEVQPKTGELPVGWDDAEWLRRLLGAIPAFLCRFDAEMGIRYINQTQPGIALEDAIGASSYDFIEPEHHHLMRDAIERLKATGNPQRYTIKGAGPDGTQIYYESLVSLVGDGSGDIALVGADVTEHVERAEALRTSEEQLRLAIDATGLGLWSFNRRTGEVSWNDRMHELTGRDEPVSPEDWVEQLVLAEDAERVASELGAEQLERLPHRIRRPDGSVRWVLLIGQDMNTGSSLVRGGVLDTTVQCELEERLRIAQRRESVGTLTAGVAHNFNNMLAVIQPAIELAARTAEGSAKTALSDALHAAERAAELVAQLMTYAGQRTSMRKVVLAPSALVGNAVRLCRQTFEKQLRLTVSVDGDPPPVRGAASDLEQLLVNLLINARDALSGRTDPAISVNLSAVEAINPGADDATPGSYVRIQIRDNGKGMSKETVERAFEPFYSEKGTAAGTGLGLAMSYAIAREHGGWISFESEEGEGTRANVFLPIASGQPQQTSPAPAAAPAGAVRVLIVEDESAVRNIVAAVLSESGHTVVAAENATAASELLDSGERPDVVLLDRSMPGWPARRAVEEIRKRAAGTKILYFTGQNVPPTELELVDGVVYKPVSIEDLEEAIIDCLAAK